MTSELTTFSINGIGCFKYKTVRVIRTILNTKVVFGKGSGEVIMALCKAWRTASRSCDNK
jgi:hypothetical protein